MGKVEKLTIFEAEALEMASWTPKERAEALRECLRLTAEHVRRAACIVQACLQAGDDLSDFPGGFLAFMRRIASGSVLAEVYTGFDGTLRQRVAMLPLADQKRLVEGETVQLLTEDAQVMKADPRKLQPEQVRQVFAKGNIRDLAEQRAWIEAEKMKRAKLKAGDEKVKILRNKNGVQYGDHFISRRELAKWLAELS